MRCGTTRRPPPFVPKARVASRSTRSAPDPSALSRVSPMRSSSAGPRESRGRDWIRCTELPPSRSPPTVGPQVLIDVSDGQMELSTYVRIVPQAGGRVRDRLAGELGAERNAHAPFG